MSYVKLQRLLETRLGLNPNPAVHQTVQKAIRHRMLKTRTPSEAAYLRLLEGSAPEWDALVEQVIVPETWFFRNRESFGFLAAYAQDHWLPNHPGEILRVLSIPCASGEEAYSIAMTLAEAGLSPGTYSIDASDVSDRSLLKAATGLYGTGSFRGSDLAYRDRFFSTAGDGQWKIDTGLRSAVRFVKGNILDGTLLSDRPPYPIIFCRNLLIYFSADARFRAIGNIRRMMAEDGILFTGHAEQDYFLEAGFKRLPHPRVFVCYLGVCYTGASYTGEGRSVKPVRDQTMANTADAGGSGTSQAFFGFGDENGPANGALSATTGENPLKKLRRPSTAKEAAEGMSMAGSRDASRDACTDLLATAREMADVGKLREALRLCSEYVKNDPGCTEAHFLLALIHEALGEKDQAERCLNRTLYLNPRHLDALRLLALMEEERGSHREAECLYRRAERCAGQKDDVS